jgi:hypothetical protein
MWEIEYAVTKRRAGKAPEGSGVPVGTEYHWYIMAHQHVRKIDANSYTTSLTGLKYKLAHRRADHEKWNVTGKTQRKRLIKVLQELISELENDPPVNEDEFNAGTTEIPEKKRTAKTQNNKAAKKSVTSKSKKASAD